MNNKRFEGDPIEALRGVDPVDPLEVPKDTSGAHARALFQEVTTMDTLERKKATQARRQPRRRLTLAVSGVAVVAIIAGSLAFLGEGSPSDDVFIAGGEPIAGAAMCAESYDLGTLEDRDVAFDGTLTSASGDQVTFTVHTWYKGGSADSVTLQAEGLAPGTITSLGASLELDQRYLVSGSGGNVWACGFTMTYDTGIADDWAAVFAG